MLLTTNHLQVRYGKQTALHIDTPITINEGDRIGIIGSNGAGKTTFVKAILGLIDYQGSIHTQLKPEQMAVHMQFNEYTSTMPVKYIMETILETRIKKDPKLKELISFFDFESCLSKKYKELSGGQKQRLTIIMVMLQDAPLTFYDEVTSGLDFETRQKLMEKLVAWYQDKKNTLMVVSHYYEELEHLVDKLLILDQGRLIAYGDTAKLFQQFCGSAIFILDNTPENAEIVKSFNRIESPEHLLALACRDGEEERRLISLLIEHNINFKRSNNDIEIMSINAKKCFYRKQTGGLS